MKAIIWTITAVLAALWTGASALFASVVGWAAGALQQAGQGTLPVPQVTAQVPAWLRGWIDPAAWSEALEALRQALGAVQWALPSLGTATGWLETLVWVVWGLGMAGLLAAAAVAHWFAGRRSRAGRSPSLSRTGS